MSAQNKIIRWFGLSLLGFIALFALCFLCAIFSVQAAETAVPRAAFIHRAAIIHRAELTRIAHASWGLNAPIPAFAAQIQQESAWNPAALSRVGAQGMAQFMPATAKWWCEVNNLSAVDCQPSNPTWAMRAMVGYDLWLYKRVWGATEYDRVYATLRSYNGGLGHWQREAKIAQSKQRNLIDAACGKARRHPLHCKENLSYPKRILNLYQPRYIGWGRMVMMGGGAI